MACHKFCIATKPSPFDTKIGHILNVHSPPPPIANIIPNTSSNSSKFNTLDAKSHYTNSFFSSLLTLNEMK